MKKLLYIFFTFHFSLLPLIAQPVTQEWVRRYSDTISAFYSASSIKSDSLGYIYVLAQTNNDFGFIKYDPNGNLLAVVTHWPSGGFESGGGTCFDVTSTGDVYITGEVNMGFSGWIYTVKFNSGGAFQWGKLYNKDNDDMANDIKVDKAGNIIVAGGSLVGSSNFALTIKYNSNGDTLWTRYFNNGQDYGIVNKIAIDDSNNTYITGNLSIPGNCLILKYNSMGTMQWFTTFANNPSHSNGGRGISIDIFGNLYVIGTESVPFSGLNDYLLKINNEGTILWNRIFTGIVSGQGRNTGTPKGPVISSDGSYIYYSSMSANGMGGGSYSIATIKYNSTGDSQWVKVYNGGGIPGANFLGGIKLDRNNNIYVCGSGYFSVTGDDFATIKYTAAGVQQWVTTYSGLVNNGGDHAQDLFIDTNFNVFVTGDAEGVNNPGVAVTIKYSQPTGIISINNQIPSEYFLHQNYPNPFNPVTNIKFDIPPSKGARGMTVKLIIYDILSREIAVLVNDNLKAGTYEVEWDGSRFSSGIYFYRLITDEFIDTKKMVLIK